MPDEKQKLEVSAAIEETRETLAGIVQAPATEPTITASPEPEAFPDLAKLRLDQNFAETAGVKKLLTTVPVRRPNAQHWVRVRPEPGYREILALIELRDDREFYLLLPHIAHELPGEFVSVVMYTATTRQGTTFLWPVKLPGPDGRQMAWHRSAAEAAELAMTRWIRIKADMALGAYQIYEAAAPMPDPEWPDVAFQRLIEIAFRDCLVTTFDHPVVKKLLGRA